MRSYSVAVAALAIGAPRKWTDNVLSQHQLPEIVSVRQGVARRIPYHTLIQLALIRELTYNSESASPMPRYSPLVFSIPDKPPSSQWDRSA